MMKRKRRKLVIYGCAAICVLLVVILAAEGVSSLSKKKIDTSKGLQIIKQAESGNVTSIENKIEKLEEKDRTEQSAEEIVNERNYKAIFANSVIMGDSISEAFTEFDILNPSSVVAKIGVELEDLDEQIESVVKINPQIVFLSYGMNDIIATQGDTKLFTKEYDALIKKIQEKLPDTKIFVNSIFPVQKQEIEREPVFEKLDNYNEALHALCDKRQIAFIDNTSLVSDQYYEEDGVHFKASFYPYWLTRMAEVASL